MSPSRLAEPGHRGGRTRLDSPGRASCALPPSHTGRRRPATRHERSQPGPRPANGAARVSRERFDAVLFDLDGVLTDTARLHARCWKRVFDDFLERWAAQRGEDFRPFDEDGDYLSYVDGKPRLDGVRDFLASRGIDLRGDSRPASFESPARIAERKDALFGRALASEGVQAYDGSVRWLRRLRQLGFRTAVVSASRHCAAVVRAAGLEGLFDTRVDGEVAARLQLAGKPAPDTFLQAARELGVAPGRAVVVEDAIAGVRAGRAGRFALVIGVARRATLEELSAAGADLVVRDLEEMLT